MLLVSASTLAQRDQRKRLRFPIAMKLHCSVGSSENGDGVVSNIGSAGLLFQSVETFKGSAQESDKPPERPAF